MQQDFAIICGLMMQSEYHRTTPLSEVERFLLPPLLLKQYRIFYDDRGPSGFVTWAFLDRDASDGYADQTRDLEPGDWSAGDQLWLVNFAALRGGVHRLRKKLCDIFPDFKEARVYRTRKNSVEHYRRFTPKADVE
jgi:cytolysin-activating lysine-acyltransferase